MGLSIEKQVGIVFFIALVILVVFTIVLSDVRLFKSRYDINVIFDDVGGLEKGDIVYLGGMEVGGVDELIQKDGKIRVVLAIRRDIKIPRDSIFQLGEVGLLGGKRVDISWGNEESGFIQDGEEFPGISPPGISEAIAKFGETGDQFDEVLSSIKKITDKIARGEGTVGKLINDDTVYQDAKKLVSDLQKTVRENQEGVKATLNNLEEITAKIKRGEGSLGKLISDDQVINEVKATMKSLDTAGNKLTSMLSKVERVRIYLGGEAAYNIRSEQTLSKAFLQIEPNSSQLYRVGVGLLSGPGTEAERTDDPDVELDAQIGFRFFSDRLTVRGGLLEGRLGGGIDFRIWYSEPEGAPFNRKAFSQLVATVEGRDVWTKEKDEGIDPFLLRSRLTLDLLWGFYLQAGGDNLLDDPGFNVGGGLRIRDDDIKALFGLISIGQ